MLARPSRCISPAVRPAMGEDDPAAFVPGAYPVWIATFWAVRHAHPHEIRMTHGDMGIHPLLPPVDYLRAHSGQAALRTLLGRIYLVHLCRRSS